MGTEMLRTAETLIEGLAVLFVTACVLGYLAWAV